MEVARLSGEPPFFSRDTETLLRRNVQNDYHMDENHWTNVSEEGKDLIRKMLEFNPEKRIKLSEAFNHPWVKNRKNLLNYQGRNRKPKN